MATPSKKPVKQKKCKICKELFAPFQFAQVVCANNGYACAREHAHQQREKSQRKEQKAFRAETRRLKDKIKTKAQWAKEAQAAFNKYIRARDEGKPCISCQKPPKKKNAGHYKSVGAHPEMRFDEDNNHLQCEHCNTYLSGNQINYRINLINKIGLARVEALEGAHDAKNYSIDDLKEIKSRYSGKAREMEKEING